MILLQALYFMLPVYLANMAPVFATKIFGDKFSAPIDLNLKLNNRPLFGSHKTWRGLIAGVFVGVLTVYCQIHLFNFEFWQELSLLDYYQINGLLYGFLFGLGVILGDLIKSFFKRRLNIKSGARWLPWDQLDFLGGLLLIFLVYVPHWSIIVIILIISPLLPMVANWLGYQLKIKKVAW